MVNQDCPLHIGASGANSCRHRQPICCKQPNVVYSDACTATATLGASGGCECLQKVVMPFTVGHCRCQFQLKKEDELAAAAARLSNARQQLQKSHGEDGSRMRQLHGGSSPQLAM